MEQAKTEKNTGVVRKVTGKVVAHSNVRHEIPRFVIYIIGILGIIAIIFGTIQQFRIMRWSKLLAASKIRIIELEKEKEEAVLKTTKDLSTKAISISKEKIKVINEKIQKIKKEKDELKTKVGRMDPSGLKKGFKEEGF